mmetsp:Transcript_28802/g.53573  ORF Transcript_28802/g.53573 Transcript_28802/m.53573 type:complete len:105 (+) Transcript_28802:4643-4957(+)
MGVLKEAWIGSKTVLRVSMSVAGSVIISSILSGNGISHSLPGSEDNSLHLGVFKFNAPKSEFNSPSSVACVENDVVSDCVMLWVTRAVMVCNNSDGSVISISLT